MTLKLGDRNETVRRWRQVMNAMFGGTPQHPGLYARLWGPLPTDTDEFGLRAQDWQKEYERRTGQVVDGIVSDQDLIDLKVVVPYRPIWIYSAPGSGAPWSVGPPFDTGEWAKQVLHLNHQPVGYPIGGYMGLMGGDPGLSYLDVAAAYAAEQDRLLGINPDVQRAMAARATDPKAPVDVEIWGTGYSQGADIMKRYFAQAFGDGGKYERLRDRLNGLLLFGDPARQPGPTKVGNNPVGWGIARDVYPAWLNNITWSITVETPAPDFYAADDDEIRPLFYDWFIRAETSLSFVIYCAQIIIPALLNLVAPFLGGSLTSLMTVPILAAQSGLPAGQLAPIVGGVLGSSEKPDPKLIEFLSVQGILTNLPALLKLLMALPGIAAHGDYYTPRAEFGNRNGVQVACDVMAAFRR